MDKNIFTIKKQYELYLERAGVKEENMPVDQRYEIRKAFYAGVTQILILLRDDMVDFCGPDEDKGAEILTEMVDEGSEFWENEVQIQDKQLEEIMEYRKKHLRVPTSVELAAELFLMHSHAELVNDESPDKIVYRHEDVIHFLKKFGFPEPDYSKLGDHYDK